MLAVPVSASIVVSVGPRVAGAPGLSPRSLLGPVGPVGPGGRDRLAALLVLLALLGLAPLFALRAGGTFVPPPPAMT